MIQLRIRCFQSLAITLNEQPVPFRSAKGRALLIYLAVEQDRAHQRGALAGLLWPDLPEARARQNLSQTLLEVRKAIGDATATPPFFEIAPQRIAFQPHAAHWLDTAEFSKAIANQDYAQATTLYRGEFLADFFVADSDLWEEWVIQRRELFRQQALDAFLHVGTLQETRGELEEAITTVRRLLDLMPWHEEAHCALMRLLAHSGQRSAALTQYDMLTALLMDEFGVAPAPETDELYDQIVAGELVPVGPKGSAIVTTPQPAVVPFQSLAPPPHFVGRAAEIEMLSVGMRQTQTQRWALVGMGGTGKSALANYMAHLLREDFADGVLWANPNSSSLLDILTQWGTAYGHDFSALSDLSSRAAAVRGLLADKTVLLILDNVEETEGLQLLLPNHNACRVLLTTRNWDVAAALNAEAVALGELAPNNAEELLIQILGKTRFESETEAAQEICRQLHYLPLALEIVGQRLKARRRISLEATVERLRQEAHRLDLVISDRAIRTSFAVSWAGLNPVQQRLFAHLAAFGGRSFSVAAATHVLQLDPFETEDRLYELAALSLLKEEEEDRFGQHPLLADFAREKLGEDQTPLRMMIDYYHHFAEEHQLAYQMLAGEWGNIAHAIKTAYRLGAWRDVLTFTDILTAPWITQARFDEARQAYRYACEAAERLQDPAAKAKAALRWAEAAIEQSLYAEALELLSESHAYYEAVDNREQLATIHYHLGSVAHEQGDLILATTHAENALTLYEQLADRDGIATAHFLRAYIYYDQEQFDAALEWAKVAMQIQEEPDARPALVTTLRLYATVLIRFERYDDALTTTQRALVLSEKHQNKHEIASNLYTITAIYLKKRDFAAAERYGLDALQQFQQFGLLRLEGMVHYQLSALYRDLEEYQQGIEHAQESIAIFRHLGDDAGCAYALLLLGDLNCTIGAVTDSHTQWTEAHRLGQATENKWIMQESEKRLA